MRPLPLLLFCLAACSPSEPPGSSSDSDAEAMNTTSGTTVPTTDSTATPPEPHSNVLVLSIDTLRRDHVGRYDSQGRNLTPFLDRLMNEGTVAEVHHPGSNWTYHSMSTALAGRYPLDAGVLPVVNAMNHRGWPETGNEFLADALVGEGFFAAMASANGWLKPDYALGTSYHSYTGDPFDPAAEIYDLATSTLQAGLESGAADRWYLHLHFLEPHAPYVPPAEYRVGEELLEPAPWNLDTQPFHYATVNDWPQMTAEEQALLEAHLRVRYEGEIRWMDHQLETFWADLDARGWLDDTLVVVFSDHGEQFWERNMQAHAYAVHAEETTGLFFTWSKTRSPSSVTARTSGIDIAPTIVSELGLDAPASWSGSPLSAIPSDRPVYTDANARLGVVQAVTRGDRHLAYLWATGEANYYDLDSDPAMQVNLYDPTLPEVMDLWELLRPRIAAGQALEPGQTPVAPPGLQL